MSRTRSISRCMFVLFFLLLFVAGPASAWVGVGAAPTCEVRTIQAAIDRIMARERAGDFIDPHIIVAGGTFNETLNIDPVSVTGILTVTGGYAADCSGPQAGAVTTIDAIHHSGSALTVHGTVALSLDTLSITGANTGGNGGGIDFDGAGTLDVTNVDLRNNHAGRGGGLYANGSGSGLTIHLHHDTDVFGNSADHSAGGIRVQGFARLFMLEGSQVSNNTVNSNDNDGAGGGIQVVGPAQADIGSGVISFNSARYGGGISVNGSNGDDARLRFFMTRQGQPTRIENNRATRTGGGLFLGSVSSITGDFERGYACGFGYSVSGNAAMEGAAIYVDTSSVFGTSSGGSAVLSPSILTTATFLCGPEPAEAIGALFCATGSACNTINGNRAEDENGSPTNGSTLLVQTDADLSAEQVQLRGNRGGHVWHGFETDSPESCSNCLIVDNQTTGDLIRFDEGGELRMNSCTIAINAIGGSNVFSLSGDLTLTESLVWQSNRTTLAQDGGHQRNVHNVLASEIVSLGGGADVEAVYPNFLDPTHGDYHLAAGSHALDYAVARGGNDLDGFPRTIDLPTPNRPGGGPLDLGAYERQTFPHFPPEENFDELTGTALPEGWLNDSFGGGAGWYVVGTDAASAPNAVFTDDPETTTDKSLETPSVSIVAGGRLRFRHKMDLDGSPGSGVTFDGVVLDIAIGVEPFRGIFESGGSFVVGGYDRIIFSGSGNPLAGRAAWGGATPGYTNVIVKLPASADGQSVRFRWRMGTDNFQSGGGYWLDDVRIDVNGADRIFCNSFETNPDDCQ